MLVAGKLNGFGGKVEPGALFVRRRETVRHVRAHNTRPSPFLREQARPSVLRQSYVRFLASRCSIAGSMGAAMQRELQEESGVTATKVKQVGIIEFEFTNEPKVLEVHVFLCHDWSGSPVET